VVRRPKPKAAYTPLSDAKKPSFHTTLYPGCLGVEAVLKLPFSPLLQDKKVKR
jgi:hypothetical protein